MDVVAIGAALGLAFVLGVSDAPNATAALVASRAAAWHVALAYSFVLHATGALLGGTAVAFTVSRLVQVPDADVAPVFAAASIAAIVLILAAARLGLPSSGTYGLLGGLVGAAVVAGGTDDVRWGGFAGGRPVGVFGTLAGLVLSPLVGVCAGWLVRGLVVRATRRASRRLLGPVRGGVWLASGLVALSDGTNDGQKAAGVAVAVLLAGGSLHRFEVPFWVQASVAFGLALGTVVGGGRAIRRVSRGYYRPTPLDALSAQSSAAAVILGAAVVGAPVSTSTVTASAVVGAGADRHPRHVRWAGVVETMSSWLLAVPLCAALGAGLYACANAIR